MKVERDLTSKAIFYFSLTGNTKAILEGVEGFDVYDIETLTDYNFDYDIILLGLPTYGRGSAHPKTWDFLRKFINIKRKKIGLFGSGNSIYPQFCGVLDILEERLSVENEILFKFKFEAYPSDKAKKDFQKLIQEINDTFS